MKSDIISGESLLNLRISVNFIERFYDFTISTVVVTFCIVIVFSSKCYIIVNDVLK